MLKRLMVINVVGLTRSLVGENTPNLKKLMDEGSVSAISPVLPAVTCSVQATYLTGLLPSEHGIVGNGWYFRDQNEVRFWHQSHQLMQGEKIWEAMRRKDPEATCANLFWWYNMNSSADYSVTVRPMYPADGRKIPDIYTQPIEWRQALNEQLGQFPLFNFWGPKADITSSRWIVNATLKTLEKFAPTLTLVYLPHLDYALQKLGPDHADIAKELQLLDAECGRLIQAARSENIEVVVLSEYGIQAVDQPIHLNRVLREAGFLKMREELGREILDAGASEAFAVADHQVAHIYIRHPENIEKIRALISAQSGVDYVLGSAEKAEAGLDHARSGELVAVADHHSWFTYYFWLDDDKAPDYARTVDIHRKPGYDPVELFINPKLVSPLFSMAWRLLKKKMGFRTLMDMIPLNPFLVRGSHGSRPVDENNGAILISSREHMPSLVLATDIRDFLLGMMSRIDDN